MLFDSQSERVILRFMAQNPNHSSPFAELGRILPQYTAKQIHHHWKNKLNPLLNHNALTYGEKMYIYNWVQNHGTSWKNCQQDMQMVFGRLHAQNKIKNAWNCENKRLLRISAQTTVPVITTPSPIEPNLNHFNMTEYDRYITCLLNRFF